MGGAIYLLDSVVSSEIPIASINANLYYQAP
jgi:hypothetical protein